MGSYLNEWLAGCDDGLRLEARWQPTDGGASGRSDCTSSSRRGPLLARPTVRLAAERVSTGSPRAASVRMEVVYLYYSCGRPPYSAGDLWVVDRRVTRVLRVDARRGHAEAVLLDYPTAQERAAAEVDVRESLY